MLDLAKRARGAGRTETVAHAETSRAAEHPAEPQGHSLPTGAAVAVAVADRADDQGAFTGGGLVELVPADLPAAPRVDLRPGSLPGGAAQPQRLFGVLSRRLHSSLRCQIHESRSEANRCLGRPPRSSLSRRSAMGRLAQWLGAEHPM